jgi:hypothetical protein
MISFHDSATLMLCVFGLIVVIHYLRRPKKLDVSANSVQMKLSWIHHIRHIAHKYPQARLECSPKEVEFIDSCINQFDNLLLSPCMRESWCARFDVAMWDEVLEKSVDDESTSILLSIKSRWRSEASSIDDWLYMLDMLVSKEPAHAIKKRVDWANQQNPVVL